MVFRFRMDIDRISLTQVIKEQINPVIGMLDHQMHIQRFSRRLRYVAHVVQRHGKIRDVTSVHNIYMKRINAALF